MTKNQFHWQFSVVFCCNLTVTNWCLQYFTWNNIHAVTCTNICCDLMARNWIMTKSVHIAECHRCKKTKPYNNKETNGCLTLLTLSKKFVLWLQLYTGICCVWLFHDMSDVIWSLLIQHGTCWWRGAYLFCQAILNQQDDIPDNKVHGATMGPSGANRTHVGPMNFAIWDSRFAHIRCIFYWHILAKPASDLGSNYIHVKQWVVITHPCPTLVWNYLHHPETGIHFIKRDLKIQPYYDKQTGKGQCWKNASMLR